MTDGDLRNVFRKYRDAVGLRKQDVFDVANLVTLRQICRTAAVHEPHAPDIDGLLAHVDGAAAHVDVGIADGCDDLRQRDVVGVELVQIDFDIVLLGSSAPSIDLDYARNSQETALQDPILNRAQVRQSEVRRSDHLVPENFAD